MMHYWLRAIEDATFVFFPSSTTPGATATAIADDAIKAIDKKSDRAAQLGTYASLHKAMFVDPSPAVTKALERRTAAQAKLATTTTTTVASTANINSLAAWESYVAECNNPVIDVTMAGAATASQNQLLALKAVCAHAARSKGVLDGTIPLPSLVVAD